MTHIKELHITKLALCFATTTTAATTPTTTLAQSESLLSERVIHSPAQREPLPGRKQCTGQRTTPSTVDYYVPASPHCCVAEPWSWLHAFHTLRLAPHQVQPTAFRPIFATLLSNRLTVQPSDFVRDIRAASETDQSSWTEEVAITFRILLLIRCGDADARALNVSNSRV